jgi:hypothetical protein
MGAPSIPPLSWPASGKPPAGPSTPPLIIYAIIMLIGGLFTLIVGHPWVLLAAVLLCGFMFARAQRALRQPVVLHVREQLLARPESLHLWATEPNRLELARVLCTALARAKKWPNAHFIPEDPLEVAFFEVSGIDGDSEVLEVGAELTKTTGGNINWHQLREIARTRAITLVDLLEASLEHEQKERR